MFRYPELLFAILIIIKIDFETFGYFDRFNKVPIYKPRAINCINRIAYNLLIIYTIAEYTS